MKKVYLSPSMSVQHIKLQQMIANSPITFTASGESGQGQLIDDEASGTALGRRGSNLWDEED